MKEQVALIHEQNKYRTKQCHIMDVSSLACFLYVDHICPIFERVEPCQRSKTLCTFIPKFYLFNCSSLFLVDPLLGKVVLKLSPQQFPK